MERLGLRFEIVSSDIEEVVDPQLTPPEMAVAFSRRKAGAVARRHPDAVVIAADTLGVLDGCILGKPGDAEEARRMLKSMSGKAHSVFTGLTVIDGVTGASESRSVETVVRIKRLTDREIEAYVRTGEPLDKAGAYAIQGLGAVIVEGIEGDYYNVIGLPLAALADTLKRFGIDVLAGSSFRGEEG